MPTTERVHDRLLRGAPDPEAARRRFDALVAAGLTDADLESQASQDVLRLACTHAPYLASLLRRDLGRLRAVAADPHLRREKPRAVMAAELASELAAGLAEVTDEPGLLAGLRAYRAREFVRLGARECGLGDRAEVGRELAHLAEVCFDAAIRFHDAVLSGLHGEPLEETEDGTTRRARFVVLGMGKLGGHELNFSSDVDIIYVYSSDQGAAGKLSLHEYFDKLARRVSRALGEVTEDDLVFRVDLRLRPEGSRGPLVNSLPSLERYYESWGRPWERQAWLKARPSAGDLDLGAEAQEMLLPFVYPRTVGPGVVREVEELNRRIKAELVDPRSAGFDVKLGRGGIREVEFFAQALQLVHAGKQPPLRERSTRGTLDRLLFAGLVAERERRALADAYDFLRHVEHLLQLEAGNQTQKLPIDHHALEVLALRLGCADAGELASILERHTTAVGAIFDTLGGPAPLRPGIAVLLDPGRAPEEVDHALASLGFRGPEQAAFSLDLLRKKPSSPFGPAATEAGARIAPALLEEIAASPDPDQALEFAVDFVGRRGAWDGLWRMLDENPPLLRLLCSLFGTSAFLAREFVQHPELLDTLLLAGPGGIRGTSDIAAALDDRLAAVRPGDEEAAWNALRRVKNEELLRIGLADVAGELDEESVTSRLADLADACVERTFALVRGALERRHGTLAPMAVLALGKFGARELGYASDLDLIFVYEGGIDEHETMSKLAQRLVNALGTVLEEGRLYMVDTRLRPSGAKGTLVSSLTAWRQYHESEAQLWERQALIKTRAVAGDRALGARLEREVERFVYEGPRRPAAELTGAVGAMRQRIETELAHETRTTWDIKAGRGGLLDVEFGAQLLQLVHGPAHPGLRVRGTLQALERAASAGLIDEELRATLVGGYRFLRRLEHRMRIVHDRPIHELLRDPDELDKLSRRAGFPSAAALERSYRNWTRDVRAAYEELLRRTEARAD